MKVAIGPVIRRITGVRQHILGIKKFSVHGVRTVPSDFENLLLGKSLKRRSYYQTLVSKTKLKHFDVVHSHVNPWFTGVCRASRSRKCKWVHTYHSYYFEADYPFGLLNWQKDINDNLIRVASNADLKITVSQWLHDFLMERYSIKTTVIPNGFRLDKCNQARPERFSGIYGLKDYVLFVGYMSPIKRPELFVRLARQIPSIQFVMIGRGLHYEAIADYYQVPIPPNIIFTGQLQHTEVLDAMAACRVFVMTSRREGLPTALLEAMAMSKPVVAPDNYGCREVVNHEEDGLLFEPDSLEDLVEKTKQAFDAKILGQKARENVVATYAWNVVARTLDAAYESLL